MIYLSGITFCAFSKVPPVSASDEAETTVLRVLNSVKIGMFGVEATLRIIEHKVCKVITNWNTTAGFWGDKVSSIGVYHRYHIARGITDSWVWVRWWIIQHLVEFFYCILGRCRLAGGDFVEGWERGWVYFSFIVKEGAIDGLHTIFVCGVEFWCGDFLGS